MSNSLQPHGPQHAWLPSPSLLLELAQIHVHYGIRFFIYFPHVCAREALLSHRVAVFSSILKEPPSCFPQWLHRLTALPTVWEGSLSSTFSPALVISVVFDDNHSDRCEVTSHCSLICISLMISPRWASFHVPPGHPYVLFGKVSRLLLDFSQNMKCFYTVIIKDTELSAI